MSDPFLGEIRIFAGNFAPRGWAVCDGSFLPIAQNEALFALVGTTYGGDGQETFRLPDLRGRFGIHQGQGPGLQSYAIGQSLGTETVTLTSQQLAAHSHPANAAPAGNDLSPGGNVWSTDAAGNTAAYNSTSNAQMAAGALSMTGGNQPHDNVQPYLVINYIIALEGIFPSQN